MQSHVQTARARQSALTFLDLVATVNDITQNEEETAEVINYMLQKEHVAFTNETPRELRRLLS